MSLSANVLSAAIRADLVQLTWLNDDQHLTDLCDAIATAVVNHITGSGIVNPAGTMIAPTGGGPVTGTGTIL